ncbi:NAD-dependent malic enzyme [Longirhabdus pacifica]|uniref:NAD-dependent malic enzyme n=1 Tax=Longirhabdus pacifica TaxID=2305227 RepID=UPI0019805AC5|nr:NAD-dependent malic enzyme [Longirhabdus pacifica]
MMNPLSGKSFILRVEMDKVGMKFAEMATAISELGGDIVAIDVISTYQTTTIRDITVTTVKTNIIDLIVNELEKMEGLKIVNVSDRTFLLHLGGKIEIKSKNAIQNRDDLSRVYTPEVSRVCMAIQNDPQKAYSLTIKRNTVAVVTDSSAVLGLGKIHPHASMPVMEGKAMLFKELADVDAFPVSLSTNDTEKIIETIKHIAPTFGGINLEDIASPRCFEIEERLKQELDIPVFHDDQHGTAVVLYAALINALKTVNKKLSDVKVVICGIGAAGVACSKMLMAGGVKEIIGVDREGALVKSKTYDQPVWNWYAQHSNPNENEGSLSEVLKGADVFIGVSTANILKREDIERMATDPIVFAMANPVPEIMPEEIEDIAAVIATGRSDFPNQINNVLCFPGIFRAALDCRASTINEEMKLAAAEAIAGVISEEEVSKHYIIPSVFNKKVVKSIRLKVIQAAIDTGVARRIPRDFRS